MRIYRPKNKMRLLQIKIQVVQQRQHPYKSHNLNQQLVLSNLISRSPLKLLIGQMLLIREKKMPNSISTFWVMKRKG